MKEIIKARLKDIEEMYNWYLEKLDDKNFIDNPDYVEDRLHDLRVQRWLLESLLKEEDEK